MKQLFTITVLWCILSVSVLNAQIFVPTDYLDENIDLARVYKSHVPNDSIVLHTISAPIKLDAPELRSIISMMYKTVTDSLSRGVGIAAPQIGINKRVILVQRFDKPNEPFEAYVNPTIIKYSMLKAMRTEGCLSIDDFRCEVERSYAILLGYFSIDGEYKLEMVEDFVARIFQHEIDHLDGILFTERIETP
ncbi:MAG: peptide deformylase [Bacteroidetes bacterium HGW-Bacteroidetes-15]|nr:MAG: peptide deformylase [Bacteroidetes bacterium HGW-Bacteroidetes-15]